VTEHGDDGVARIKEMTGGGGAVAVLECAGTQEPIPQAVRSTWPLGPGRTAAVITSAGHRAVLTDGRRQLPPAITPATLALAPGADSTTDALAVHQATLTIWHLASGQPRWRTEQIITGPIQDGSSG
jgi:threonine dehydrogenase-like Zn-dependent dehydrogenase